MPEQTVVHAGNSQTNIKITHLLETAYSAGVQYIWKIPLLKNPSTINIPFRMNITLWTYQAGSSLGQKELFYEIVNKDFTTLSNPSSVSYDFATQNQVQSTTASLSVELNSYTPAFD